jgi:hypothetical protein
VSCRYCLCRLIGAADRRHAYRLLPVSQSERVNGLHSGKWAAGGSILTFIDLDSNYFTGSLPASLASSSALQSVNASNNLLSGSLPASFSQSSALEVVLLQTNKLTGPIAQMINASAQLNLPTLQVEQQPAYWHSTGRVVSAPSAVCLRCGEQLTLLARCHSPCAIARPSPPWRWMGCTPRPPARKRSSMRS